MIEEKIKVAAYCRVSTESSDQANSLASQKKYFYDYIQSKMEWKLVKIYFDEGISGTLTSKRKGFLQLMEDAFHGEIDLILSKDISRFARNTVDTLDYIRKLKATGVRVIFINDNFDSDKESSEFLLSVKASLAQEESRKTSERVKWGQRRRMEAGVVFGRDLIGFTVKNGKLFINPKEVPIVKTVFHKYTNEGKGTHTIARELLEEGYYPKRGKRWNPIVILRMLRNEKYVGDLKQGKTYTPSFLNHKKKYNYGQVDFVEIKNHHEGIISRDLWDRTQKVLKSRSMSEEQKKKYSNRYWCSGKIFCGLCGERYVARLRKRKDGSQYKAWRCHKNMVEGREKVKENGEQVGCSSHSMNEMAIRDSMRFAMRYIGVEKESLKQEIIKEIQKVKDTLSEEEDPTKDLREQIEKVENKKKKCMDFLLDGVISQEDFTKQKQWYDQEIQKCLEMLEKRQNVKSRQKHIAQSMEDYLVAIDKILSFEEDSESVYTEILEKMVVYPQKILHIFLKGVPFVICLKIQTKGRQKNYRTEILEVKIIEENKMCREK